MIHHEPRPFDSAVVAVIGVADAAGACATAFRRGVSRTFFAGRFSGAGAAATGSGAGAGAGAGFASSFAGGGVSSATGCFTGWDAQPVSANRTVTRRNGIMRPGCFIYDA